MELSLISRFIITLALFSQLIHVITVNKQIYSNAFIVYAIGSYIMAYNYYLEDTKQITYRVMFKLFNSTVILLIGVLSMKK
jgi:hypothetical protein